MDHGDLDLQDKQVVQVGLSQQKNMAVIQLVQGVDAGVLHFPMTATSHQCLKLFSASMPSDWINHAHMLHMLHMLHAAVMRQPLPET